MTNAERIQAHNELLVDCIETAENLPDAGSGGTSGDAIYTAFASNWYISVGNQGVPVSFVIFFKQGWTWADYIASEFNKCPESIDGSLTANKGPVQAVKASSNGELISAITSVKLYILKDYDDYEIATSSDLIEANKIYYIA